MDLPSLTLDDFKTIDWQSALVDAKETTCFGYMMVLNRKAAEAQAANETKREAVLRLMASLVSLSLRPDKQDEPLGVGVSGNGWRSPALSDFSEEQLNLLVDLYPTVVDAEMRARVADVVWVTKRDYKAAHTAITAYLDSALSLEDHAKWGEAFHRVARAAMLAASVKGDPLDAAVKHIERVLKDSETVDAPSYFAAKLLGLLLDIYQGVPATHVAQAEIHANRAENAKDWAKAQVYWNLAARWHRRNKDEASAKGAQLREAETYIQDAAMQSSASLVAHRLGMAIEALRRIGGQRERIDELHRQLLQHQKNARREFKTISASIDGTEMVKAAVASVQKKDVGEALLALCRVFVPLRVEAIRKEVEESAKTFLFMSLFPSSIVSNEGKVIARRGPVRTGLDDEDQDAIVAHMYSNANQHRHIATTALIEPARREIWASHHLGLGHFLALANNNPFVPRGREHLFARGLYAGMCGEFDVALHLLMPQVENSVRVLMASRGVIVSALIDGIQQERDLGSLLRDDEASKLFGEDLLFDLRGLLIQRYGSNLRNTMAHGLMSSADTFSTQSRYFWWLTLWLICHPYLVASADQAPPDDPPEADGGHGAE